MTKIYMAGLLAIAGALASPIHAQSGKKSSSAAAPETVAACPSAYPGGALVCACEGGGGGSVWGDGPYTADSNICTAAQHAGALDDGIGAIQLTEMPGQASYAGSTANGVTTNSWGSYGKSFDVARAGAAKAGAGAGLPACTTLPAGAEIYACTCPANPVLGSVWGSDPFTADSDICTAALFASYIEQSGGVVHVLRAPGLEYYLAGTGNGVSTSEWQAYEASIVFDWNQ